MPDVSGIDHIYLTVSDLDRAEAFYDRVLLGALGFRKNRFTLGGEAHVQYFNHQRGQRHLFLKPNIPAPLWLR